MARGDGRWRYAAARPRGRGRQGRGRRGRGCAVVLAEIRTGQRDRWRGGGLGATPGTTAAGGGLHTTAPPDDVPRVARVLERIGAPVLPPATDAEMGIPAPDDEGLRALAGASADDGAFTPRTLALLKRVRSDSYWTDRHILVAEGTHAGLYELIDDDDDDGAAGAPARRLAVCRSDVRLVTYIGDLFMARFINENTPTLRAVVRRLLAFADASDAVRWLKGVLRNPRAEQGVGHFVPIVVGGAVQHRRYAVRETNLNAYNEVLRVLREGTAYPGLVHGAALRAGETLQDRYAGVFPVRDAADARHDAAYAAHYDAVLAALERAAPEPCKDAIGLEKAFPMTSKVSVVPAFVEPDAGAAEEDIDAAAAAAASQVEFTTYGFDARDNRCANPRVQRRVMRSLPEVPEDEDEDEDEEADDAASADGGAEGECEGGDAAPRQRASIFAPPRRPTRTERLQAEATERLLARLDAIEARLASEGGGAQAKTSAKTKKKSAPAKRRAPTGGGGDAATRPAGAKRRRRTDPPSAVTTTSVDTVEAFEEQEFPEAATEAATPPSRPARRRTLGRRVRPAAGGASTPASAASAAPSSASSSGGGRGRARSRRTARAPASAVKKKNAVRRA